MEVSLTCIDTTAHLDATYWASLGDGCKAEHVYTGKRPVAEYVHTDSTISSGHRKFWRPLGEPLLALAQSAICKSFTSHSQLMTAEVEHAGQWVTHSLAVPPPVQPCNIAVIVPLQLSCS